MSEDARLEWFNLGFDHAMEGRSARGRPKDVDAKDYEWYRMGHKEAVQQMIGHENAGREDE